MTEERVPPQDPRVEAFLATLGQAPVPGDLAASVVAGVRARPGRRPSLRLPLLAAAAAILVVVLVPMAAGWRPPIDVMPGFGAASPAPTPTLEPEGPFEFARVTAAGAEMRTAAGAGTVLRRTNDGDVGVQVLVRDRRVVAGRTWVEVEWLETGSEAGFVWLPETTESIAPTGYQVPVLEVSTWLPCPDPVEPPPDAIAGLTLAERLDCMGPPTFTLGPVQVRSASDGQAATGSPAWLAGPAADELVSVDPAGTGGIAVVAPVRIDPALGLQLPTGAWIRVTVHFDDPAAAGCTRIAGSPDAPVGDRRDQVLWCRQQLVVTGYADAPAPTPTPVETP